MMALKKLMRHVNTWSGAPPQLWTFCRKCAAASTPWAQVVCSTQCIFDTQLVTSPSFYSYQPGLSVSKNSSFLLL